MASSPSLSSWEVLWYPCSRRLLLLVFRSSSVFSLCLYGAAAEYTYVQYVPRTVVCPPTMIRGPTKGDEFDG